MRPTSWPSSPSPGRCCLSAPTRRLPRPPAHTARQQGERASWVSCEQPSVPPNRSCVLLPATHGTRVAHHQEIKSLHSPFRTRCRGWRGRTPPAPCTRLPMASTRGLYRGRISCPGPRDRPGRQARHYMSAALARPLLTELTSTYAGIAPPRHRRSSPPSTSAGRSVPRPTNLKKPRHPGHASIDYQRYPATRRLRKTTCAQRTSAAVTSRDGRP
jgi:hypothetical protein